MEGRGSGNVVLLYDLLLTHCWILELIFMLISGRHERV